MDRLRTEWEKAKKIGEGREKNRRPSPSSARFATETVSVAGEFSFAVSSYRSKETFKSFPSKVSAAAYGIVKTYNFVWKFKSDLVKAVVSRAFCLRECP